MIKITDKEFLDWLYSQPDEQMVDMRQERMDQPCGCLMIQFARSKKMDGVHHCGSISFCDYMDNVLATLSRYPTFYFNDVYFQTVASFKELKERLKPQFKR